MSAPEMSERAKNALREWGNFGPTARAELREVKGYIQPSDPDEDGRTYRDAGQLRELAAGLIEAADWLDARADAAVKS